jgi:MFS family permease
MAPTSNASVDQLQPFLRSPSRSQDDSRQEFDYGSTQSAPRTEQDDDTQGISIRTGPDTPLPKMQITILFIMRMSEPIALLSILPFVYRMVQENLPGVPEKQIGYYIGFIESVFAIVQFVTVFLWGRVSDRIGRKPVLLIGLAGTFVSVNCYGLSKTFPQMILARSIAGLMNANIGVLKSMMGEITDETNQARAFSLLPLSFAVGSIIGPSIGGKLSNPTESFPDLFGNSAFLAKYPYWLPCFVSTTFNLFGFIAGLLFLKESLPASARRQEAQKYQAVTSQDNGDSTEEISDTPSPPRLRDFLTRNVVVTLINSAMMNFVNICYISILPLFLSSRIEAGGISFSKEAIGYFLGANGVITIIVQLFIFPRMEKAMGGPLNTLRRALTFLPLVFVCFPVAHFAAKEYGSKATTAVLGILLLLRGMSSIMVVSSTLCVNNVVPSRAALGSINGMQQSLGCLSRAIGPVFSTSLFAFSITHTYQFIDGQAVWLVFIGIALITWFTSAKMRKANKSQWRRH